MIKTGLVLSGGGAKGAYQAGVIQALNEMGIKIDMIAGASIGALNGAILASAPSIQMGIVQMCKLWQRLPEISLFQFNQLTKEESGQENSEQSFWKRVEKLPSMVTQNSAINKIIASIKEGSLFTDEPLQEIMNEFFDFQQLQKSIPLYISVYQQGGMLNSATEILLAEMMGINNGESSFKHLQSLSENEQKETLLASAALPLLFKSRTDAEGNRMSDGGQGGWLNAQGNTPVTPLIEAGCQRVIVTHLSNGSTWNRADFPQAVVYEIRPNPQLELSGLKATFDFSSEKITQLMKIGYQDTRKQISKIHDFLTVRAEKKALREQLKDRFDL